MLDLQGLGSYRASQLSNCWGLTRALPDPLLAVVRLASCLLAQNPMLITSVQPTYAVHLTKKKYISSYCVSSSGNFLEHRVHY